MQTDDAFSDMEDNQRVFPLRSFLIALSGSCVVVSKKEVVDDVVGIVADGSNKQIEGINKAQSPVYQQELRKAST